MIYLEDTVVEIEAGTVDDRTAQEIYRNLQVSTASETGEQALDREFGIDHQHSGQPAGGGEGTADGGVRAENKTV